MHPHLPITNQEENLVMRILSNTKMQKLAFIFLILSIYNSLSSIPINAQLITPIVTVVPPYSNKLSDYTLLPNKILITLSLNGIFDYRTFPLYLEGSITSLSGDVQIYTRPGHKPAVPITVTAQSNGLFLPYQLNYTQIRDIFDDNYLIYSGISHEQVLRNGLPEGTYRICVKVFNYDTNSQYSDEVCSNTFTIQYVEAPIIINPQNGSEISSETPQDILFQWAMPAGAPFNTKYKLKIVELTGNTINPEEAINSPSYPTFFETDVTGTVYPYTLANLPLNKGKKYAFRVTAYDPTAITVKSAGSYFKNGGRSETYTFTYNHLPLVFPSVNNVSDDTAPNAALSAYEEAFDSIVPSTTVRGRLFCKFPDNPNEAVIIRQPVLNTNCVLINSGEQNNQSQSSSQPNGYSYNSIYSLNKAVQADLNSNNYSPNNNVSLNNTASDSYSEETLQGNIPFYLYKQTEEIVNTKPLANVKIKLMVRAAVKPGSSDGYPDYGCSLKDYEATDMHGNQHYSNEENDNYNILLFETETDENGYYTFTFNKEFYTGKFEGMVVTSTTFEADQTEEGGSGGISGGGGGLQENGMPNAQSLQDQKMQYVVNPNRYSYLNSQFSQAIQSQTNQNSSRQTARSMNAQTEPAAGYFCLKIIVLDNKFSSPDVDIFAMPGDNAQVPDQVAKLKTYNLKVKAIADETIIQAVEAGTSIPNVRVAVMRNHDDIGSEHDYVINYEGQRLTSTTENNNGTFKNVSIDTTAAIDDGAYAVFGNLVCHTTDRYTIYLSTRDPETVDTDYDFLGLNYDALFDEEHLVDGNAALYGIFNHEYVPATVEAKFVMHPLKPEIKGRVMAATNIGNWSVDEVRADLLVQNNQGPYASESDLMTDIFLSGGNIAVAETKQTNSIGFFRFPDLAVNNGFGPYRRILVRHPSFKYVVMPPYNEDCWNLRYGDLKDIKDINLEPAQKLRGYVVDEDGEPVTAYVYTDYCPMYKTETYFDAARMMTYHDNYFSIPVQSFSSNKIYIDPTTSGNYYQKDTILSSLTGLLKVVVHKKLHRPEIVIRNADGDPIADVSVTLADRVIKTDNNGIARFKFESQETQFTVKIAGVSDYAARLFVLIIPNSADWRHYEITMQKAVTIRGKITDKENNSPINNAIVYAELQNINNEVIYVSASSNEGGRYELTGIPESLSGLMVHVVKYGSNPGYVGVSETITLPDPNSNELHAPYNFELQRLDDWDLSNIWGYILYVDEFNLVPDHPDQAIISGYITELPATEGFSPEQLNLKINFTDLKVQRRSDNSIEPVKDKIVLDVLEITVQINSSFKGSLSNLKSSGQQGNPVKMQLEITKTGNKAVMDAMASISKSSYNFSSQFSGELFIGNFNLGNKVRAFSVTIPAVSNGAAKTVSTMQVNPSSSQSVVQNTLEINSGVAMETRFKVFDLNNDLNPVAVKGFEVYGFTADAELGTGSVLVGEKITLETTLHTNIPMGDNPDLDLQIKAGKLIITTSNIDFEESQVQDVQFSLESWNVINKGNWRFDKNEEAMVFDKVLIKTGSIDAYVTGLLVKPASLGEGEVSLSDGGLSLGGVKQITLAGNITPLFNYDSTGHYRISIVGSSASGKPAGYIDNLPGMTDRLEFNSIGLLSDNQNAISIGKKFRFFNIVDIYVDQVTSGNGYFDLTGQPDYDVPDMTGVVQTSMRYYLDNSNQVKGKILPLAHATVECPGNVTFEIDPEEIAQIVTNKLFKAYGNIIIKETAGSNDNSYSFRGLLSKTDKACTISVIKTDNSGKYEGDNYQEMKVGKDKIVITDGLLEVDQWGNWGNLVYHGNTSAMNGFDNTANNELEFTVNGAVSATTENLKMTNIDSPFGSMNLIFNFDDGSLTGQVHSDIPVPLFFATFRDLDLTFQCDNNGFYFVLASQDMDINPIPSWRGGLIVGYTNHVIPNHLDYITQYYNMNIPSMDDGLHGIYLFVEKTLVDKALSVIWADASVQSGIGVYLFSDFSSDPAFAVGGYGYLKLAAAAGLDELGVHVCSAEACINTMFIIGGSYYSGVIDIGGCATLHAELSVQGICSALLKPVGLDDFGFSLALDYGFSTNRGIYLSPSLGSCDEVNQEKLGCDFSQFTNVNLTR
jgi:TANFOR domain-containing protein